MAGSVTPDVELLFGVLGGGSIGGASGKQIKTDLDSIISAINAKPLKIRVVPQMSGSKRQQHSEMQARLNEISASGGKGFTIKVSKIQIGSQAIADFRRQLQAVINTLTLDKGTSVTVNAAGAIGSMTGTAGATAWLQDYQERIIALKAQLKTLKTEIQDAQRGASGTEQAQRVRELTEEYTALELKVREVQKLKADPGEAAIGTLEHEAAAIRDKTQALNAETEAERRSAAAAEEKIAAEREKLSILTTANNTLASAQARLDAYTASEKSVNPAVRAARSELEAKIAALKQARDALDGATVGTKEYANGIKVVERAEKEAKLANAQFYQTVKESGEATQTLGQRIVKLGEKFGAWLSITRLIMAAIRTIRKMVEAVREVDTAMTELRKVTDETSKTYQDFLDGAAQRAKTLGATVSDVVNATANFARLGYNIYDASDLANVAILYKNVGDGIENIDDASESIISTMKAFGIEAEDAMTIVDKFNEVGNNYAITSKGVGDALMRSASAMHAAGNTLDETIALATAANTIIQNPESVGTTLKTMSMFLRSAKTELEEAGESTEGMAESVSKLREKILALTDRKVDIQIDDNTYKSTIQILRELAAVWDDLTDVKRANILEMIGGKRNANVSSALLENFEIVEEVLRTSQEAAGSALRENEKYLESIDGHVAQFKATFQAFSNALIDSGFINDIVDLGTAILEVSTYIAKFFSLFGGVANFVRIVQSGPAVLLRNDTKKERTEQNDTIAIGEKSTDEAAGIKTLLAEYTLLSAATDKTEADKARLSTIELELIDLYGVEQDRIEELTDAYGDLGQAIEIAANERKIELLQNGVEGAIAQMQKSGALGKSLDVIVDWDDDDKSSSRAYNALRNAGLLKGAIYSGLSDSEFGLQFGNQTADEVIDTYRRLEKMLTVVANAGSKTSVVYRELKSAYDSMTPSVQAYLNSSKKLAEEMAHTAVETALVGKALPATEADLVDFKTAIMESAISTGEYTGDIQTLSDAIDAVLFEEFGTSAEEAAAGVSILDDAVNETAEDITNSITAISSYKDALDTLASAYSDLLEEGGRLSYDSIESIGQKFADVEGIDEYIKRLLEVRTDAQAVDEIMDELATTYAVTQAQAELLAGADEKVVAAMLEEAGAAESDQAAIALVEIAKGKLAAASVNSADAMYDFIDSLADETAYSETARSALINLAAEMVTAENTGMNFDQQIDALIRLAEHAGVAAGAIAAVRSSMGNTAQLESQIKNAQSADEVAALVSKYQNSQNAATSNADDVLKALIKDATSNVKMSFDWSGVASRNKSGGSGGGGGGGGSSAEEYIADIDAYYEALKRLESVQLRQAEIQDQIDSADKIEDKIFYTKTLVSVYDDQANALERLNALRTESIQNGIQELEQLGFQVEYNEQTNEFLVRNMEHLNELYGGSTEATNNLRKETEELINSLEELSEANQEGADSLRDITKQMKDARKAVIDYLDSMVDSASGVVDSIQNVYNTLHKAADEYAEDGFITIDTLQDIIGLGAQYMAYLEDENGMLVINEENIQKVLAAKTQELALNEALAYVEKLRLALESGTIEELNQLLYATLETTDATWGLVYANLALLDLDSDQYEQALHNINAIRSLANSAVQSIGRVSGEARDQLKKQLEAMKDGVDDILKYVMDMLKHRIQEQIDALNDMKSAFADIIALRKEALENAKKEADYDQEVAKKIQEIAKLQARINALALDDSRSAAAERAKLEEELAELQGDLADKQAEHSREAHEAALDDMQKAYEEEKDEEIKTLEKSISSYQKLYDMA